MDIEKLGPGPGSQGPNRAISPIYSGTGLGRGPGPRSGVLAILDVKIRGFWPGTPKYGPWARVPGAILGAILGSILGPLFDPFWANIQTYGNLDLSGGVPKWVPNMAQNGSFWAIFGPYLGPHFDPFWANMAKIPLYGPLNRQKAQIGGPRYGPKWVILGHIWDPILDPSWANIGQQPIGTWEKGPKRGPKYGPKWVILGHIWTLF